MRGRKSKEGLQEIDIKREARRSELINAFKDIDSNKRHLVDQMIDEVVFLEEQLKKLRKLPMIEVHHSNPAKQRVTPAGKQYKETLQSYINAVKVLQKVLYAEGETGESPLTKMLKEFEDD